MAEILDDENRHLNRRFSSKITRREGVKITVPLWRVIFWARLAGPPGLDHVKFFNLTIFVKFEKFDSLLTDDTVRRRCHPRKPLRQGFSRRRQQSWQKSTCHFWQVCQKLHFVIFVKMTSTPTSWLVVNLSVDDSLYRGLSTNVPPYCDVGDTTPPSVGEYRPRARQRLSTNPWTKGLSTIRQRRLPRRPWRSSRRPGLPGLFLWFAFVVQIS